MSLPPDVELRLRGPAWARWAEEQRIFLVSDFYGLMDTAKAWARDVAKTSTIVLTER